jgi:hypothetical protein
MMQLIGHAAGSVWRLSQSCGTHSLLAAVSSGMLHHHHVASQEKQNIIVASLSIMLHVLSPPGAAAP